MSLLALQDLYRRCREKATGVWTLGKDPGRIIFMDYGDTVFAQSSHLQDRLTYILVERGKLTQAQMDHALANLKPGLSIGKNLIEMGFITQRDLLEVAKAQVERIVRSALTTPDQAPTFEERELDPNVVRLPMNTAQLMLMSTLSLQDREGLLELLGPLNQVVVLQGRNLMDLNLPADLAKLPPLLDGTHTLLELSRESMAEPLRLGAFALFLREMGWARLHEMPPLDRHALDLALSPEPEPLSPPLAPPEPEAFPETVPSLFSSIQEAARPTTNLEHLSLALDQHPQTPEPVYQPEALARPEAEEPPAWELGQGYPPTPVMAVSPIALEPADTPIPVRVSMDFPEPTPAPEPAGGDAGEARPAAPKAPGRGRLRTLIVLFVLVCLAGGGFLWATRFRRRWPLPRALSALLHGKRPVKHRPVTPPPPAPAPPAPVARPIPAGVAVPPAPSLPAVPAVPPAAVKPAVKPAPAAPLPVAKPVPPPAPKAPKPEPATKAPLAISVAARLKALEQGDLDLAVRQGQRLLKESPPSRWTLRLEIACQGETIAHVVDLFQGRAPDLFLLPIVFRDGRNCYQVLLGQYPSQQAAEKEVKLLPASFRAGKNRPKVFRLGELPQKQ